MVVRLSVVDFAALATAETVLSDLLDRPPIAALDAQKDYTLTDALESLRFVRRRQERLALVTPPPYCSQPATAPAKAATATDLPR